MSNPQMSLDQRQQCILTAYGKEFQLEDCEDPREVKRTITNILFILLEQSGNIEWKNEDMHPETIAYYLEKVYNFFDQIP